MLFFAMSEVKPSAVSWKLRKKDSSTLNKCKLTKEPCSCKLQPPLTAKQRPATLQECTSIARDVPRNARGGAHHRFLEVARKGLPDVVLRDVRGGAQRPLLEVAHEDARGEALRYDPQLRRNLLATVGLAKGHGMPRHHRAFPQHRKRRRAAEPKSRRGSADQLAATNT